MCISDECSIMLDTQSFDFTYVLCVTMWPVCSSKVHGKVCDGWSAKQSTFFECGNK